MKIKHILLVYKKSVYRNYFINRRSSLRNRRSALPKENLRRLKSVHDAHYKTLAKVEQVIKQSGVPYQKKSRGQKINYSKYDLVVTVGGDGTFLEAARNSKRQILLGVNSEPATSVGSYCIAERNTFARYFKRVLAGKARIVQISRLKIKGSGGIVDVLNDVLVAHKNPAAMSRYRLQVGARKEEQRSSGVWVSTAAGSTGAIHSAGGKYLSMSSSSFQYRPRELFDGFKLKYKLKGAVVSSRSTIKFVSLMREGMVFFDGARAKWPFTVGDVLSISRSPNSLKIVRG